VCVCVCVCTHKRMKPRVFLLLLLLLLRVCICGCVGACWERALNSSSSLSNADVGSFKSFLSSEFSGPLFANSAGFLFQLIKLRSHRGRLQSTTTTTTTTRSDPLSFLPTNAASNVGKRKVLCLRTDEKRRSPLSDILSSSVGDEGGAGGGGGF